MIKVVFSRIKAGKEDRVREWLAELTDRVEEVRESFRQEVVRHEQAFMLKDTRGAVLIYVMEAEDHERAQAAYRASTLAIDAEHKRVMEECLEGGMEVPLLYDVAADGQTG